MAVLVTGAAGFIGRHVVDALLARGVSVVGVDRRRWQPAAGEATVVDDLAHPSPEVQRLLATSDGVIHLAGRPGVRDSDPRAHVLRRRDNVLAGRNVLEFVPPDTPLVVASSSSVYGGLATSGVPRRETDPLRPRGGYARSKAQLEELCHQRAARGGKVSIGRPFTVAGCGQRPDMAIARWIHDLRCGRPLRLYGGAHVRRDITDVRDVAEGLVRMLEREVTTTINLGSGVNHSLAEMVDAVSTALQVRPSVEVRPPHPAEVATTLADTTRCRDLLDLCPSQDLHELVTWQATATVLELV